MLKSKSEYFENIKCCKRVFNSYFMKLDTHTVLSNMTKLEFESSSLSTANASALKQSKDRGQLYLLQ